MIIKPAVHRVQDISGFLKKQIKINELKGDVSAYLSIQQMQLDAQEDGDMEMAAAFGASMKQIREKYDERVWQKEIGLIQGE